MDDLVSPFDERSREPTPLAPRLASLEGKRITLLSISKPKSAEFLDELEYLLSAQHGAVVSRASKPTFTKPAPSDVLDGVVEGSDAVVEALAD